MYNNILHCSYKCVLNKIRFWYPNVLESTTCETRNYHSNNSGGHSRHIFTSIYWLLTAAAPSDSVFHALGTNWLTYNRPKKTAPFYFCNSFVETLSVTTIFGTCIRQSIFCHPYIPYSLYNQRWGTSLSFKSTAGQCTVHAQPSSSFVMKRQTSIVVPTWDLLTFQTLVRKLQNFCSGTGMDLLEFCARCWWAEATFDWQLVKQPADGHWSNDWSVTM